MTKMQKAELTLQIDIVGVDLNDFNWDKLTYDVFKTIEPYFNGWGAFNDTKYVLRMVELKEDK